MKIEKEFLKYEKCLWLTQVVDDPEFVRAANAFIKEVGYDNIFMQEAPTFDPDREEDSKKEIKQYNDDIRRTIENIVLRLYEGRNIFGEYMSRFKIERKKDGDVEIIING